MADFCSHGGCLAGIGPFPPAGAHHSVAQLRSCMPYTADGVDKGEPCTHWPSRWQ